MIKAIDAANFLISIMPEAKYGLTNKKVNKLLYFAQGHAFKWLGQPLFEEEIQAWNHGPVVPSIYHEFKACGAGIISKPSKKVPKLNVAEADLLMNIAQKYGSFSSTELENETHKPGTPWSNCYIPGRRNIVIEKEKIKLYFSDKELQPLNNLVNNIPVVGYLDKDGYTILPKEWKDEI